MMQRLHAVKRCRTRLLLLLLLLLLLKRYLLLLLLRLHLLQHGVAVADALLPVMQHHHFMHTLKMLERQCRLGMRERIRARKRSECVGVRRVGK